MSKIILICLFFLSACTQKMAREGHLSPYKIPHSQPDGTVALGHLKSKFDDASLKRNPYPMSKAFLERGRERFNIYCSVCHGQAGYADGPVVQRGFPAPPSYHTESFRRISDGDIYKAITQGFGRMTGYEDRLDVQDRWAVVAYVRALQLSQNCSAKYLSEADQDRLIAGGSP